MKTKPYLVDGNDQKIKNQLFLFNTFILWHKTKSPWFGINIEFTKRPTWIMPPFFIIAIIPNNWWDDGKPYVNDRYELKYRCRFFKIIKHWEPCNNDKYFNLGIDSTTLFIGNYQITKP